MPATPSYSVPDDPNDVEAAALDLIVFLPETMFAMSDPRARVVLQELTAILSIENTFAGMTWHDARHAAVAIVMDAIRQQDAAQALRKRARRARSGSDRMRWDDRAAMARALEIGAKVVAA